MERPSLLEQRLRDDGPIRVALVGAGTGGGMVARHLSRAVPHVRLVAIANRTVARAGALFAGTSQADPRLVDTVAQLDDAIESGTPAICADASLLGRSGRIEVLVEVTGTVEHGARIVCDALRHGKHVVLVNAELDSTLGPLLKTYADAAGVVLTHTDGEEPAVAMALVRYLRSIGLRPVGAGNLKGMIDPYRTPETQREFALRHGQNAVKVTSFADGTKLSMETTILANATGFRVGRRGMYGPRCQHVREMASLLPAEELLRHGLVDYALGAEPYTGAFVIVHEDDAARCSQLQYFKMGDGPFYVFYTPFHLPPMQLVSTITQAVLQREAAVAPIAGPVCEVATIAKRSLRAGESLDGVGGYLVYGEIENADGFGADGLLPIGVAEGCRLVRDVAQDVPVRYPDVELPPGRLCDELRAKQARLFGPPARSSDGAAAPVR